MTINQKKSKIHTGKTFTLCEGVNGSGATIWIVYTENASGSVHSETFKNRSEALSWWKHSCM